MKCPNCQTEMNQQQASTEVLHLEQMYCHNCGKDLLTEQEESDHE